MSRPWIPEVIVKSGNLTGIDGTVQFSGTIILGNVVANIGSISTVGNVANIGTLANVGAVANVGTVSNVGYLDGVGVVHLVDTVTGVVYVSNVGSVANVWFVSNVGSVRSVSNVGTVANVGKVDMVSAVSLVSFVSSVSNVGTAANVGTVDRVTAVSTVSAVSNVGTVDRVSAVSNVGTVDKVSAVTSVSTVSAVSNVGTVANVGTVDRVSTVSVVSNVGVVSNVNTVSTVSSVSNVFSVGTVNAVTSVSREVTVVGNAVNPVDVTFFDTATDAFGRLRTSDSFAMVQVRNLGGLPDVFCVGNVVGTGSIVANSTRSSTFLSVGNSSGTGLVGRATRQSRTRGVYQTGASLQSMLTFVAANGDGQENLVQRIGYFDDADGGYLRILANAASFVLRSSALGNVSEVVVPQSQWNVDRLDGTGSSGRRLDLKKAQILIQDFQWLGVGRVRMGFDIDGSALVAHQFLNAGNVSSVYMANPNLPLRWEIEAIGNITGVANLEQICGVVNIEGTHADNAPGFLIESDMGSTGKSLAVGQTREIIAFTVANAYASRATAFPRSVTIISIGGGGIPAYRWGVCINPTVVNPGTWSPAGLVVLKNTTRNVLTYTGITTHGGYNQTSAPSVIDLTMDYPSLGSSYEGIADVVSIQVTNLGSATTIYASAGWREVY